MSTPLKDKKRIVIKIGSSLLVEKGRVRVAWLKSLAQDILQLHKNYQEIIIVSSGAIALGKSRLKIKDGKICDARFKTFGCGSAIASSSMATELIKGRTIDEAMSFSNQEVVNALGGLPPVKIHCSVLAEEALKAALEDYVKKNPSTISK